MNIVWTRLADFKPPHFPSPYMVWEPGWVVGFEAWLCGDGITWTTAGTEDICHPTHWAPMPKPPVNP